MLSLPFLPSCIVWYFSDFLIQRFDLVLTVFTCKLKDDAIVFWNHNILFSIKPRVYLGMLYLDCELCWVHFFSSEFYWCIIVKFLPSTFGFWSESDSAKAYMILVKLGQLAGLHYYSDLWLGLNNKAPILSLSVLFPTDYLSQHNFSVHSHLVHWVLDMRQCKSLWF